MFAWERHLLARLSPIRVGPGTMVHVLDDLLAPLGRLLWVPVRFVGGVIVQIFWELVVHGLWDKLVVRRADGPDRVGWELVWRTAVLVVLAAVATAAAIALWRVAVG